MTTPEEVEAAAAATRAEIRVKLQPMADLGLGGINLSSLAQAMMAGGKDMFDIDPTYAQALLSLAPLLTIVNDKTAAYMTPEPEEV